MNLIIRVSVNEYSKLKAKAVMFSLSCRCVKEVWIHPSLDPGLSESCLMHRLIHFNTLYIQPYLTVLWHYLPHVAATWRWNTHSHPCECNGFWFSHGAVGLRTHTEDMDTCIVHLGILMGLDYAQIWTIASLNTNVFDKNVSIKKAAQVIMLVNMVYCMDFAFSYLCYNIHNEMQSCKRSNMSQNVGKMITIVGCHDVTDQSFRLAAFVQKINVKSIQIKSKMGWLNGKYVYIRECYCEYICTSLLLEVWIFMVLIASSFGQK